MRVLPGIEERLRQFRDDLRARSAASVVQKHVIDGDCYALSREEHFALREEVAEHFKIRPAEVVVVGSSKLGFSISPKQLYRQFDDDSDIDLAVVSQPTFDEFWDAALGYWTNNRPPWEGSHIFMKYLFRGKIFPQFLPPSPSFPLRQQLEGFFDTLTASGKFGPYRCGAHIYRSWYHLELYQMTAVSNCQRKEREAPTL